MIAAKDGRDLVPDLNKPQGRIEIAELVVAILDHSADLVAQSQVHDQPRSDPPVILSEGGVLLIG